jgi:hypothetical protein
MAIVPMHAGAIRQGQDRLAEERSLTAGAMIAIRDDTMSGVPEHLCFTPGSRQSVFMPPAKLHVLAHPAAHPGAPCCGVLVRRPAMVKGIRLLRRPVCGPGRRGT